MSAATGQGKDDHLAFLKYNSLNVEYTLNKMKNKKNNNAKKNANSVPHTQEQSISSPHVEPFFLIS